MICSLDTAVFEMDRDSGHSTLASDPSTGAGTSFLDSRKIRAGGVNRATTNWLPRYSLRPTTLRGWVKNIRRLHLC